MPDKPARPPIEEIKEHGAFVTAPYHTPATPSQILALCDYALSLERVMQQAVEALEVVDAISQHSAFCHLSTNPVGGPDYMPRCDCYLVTARAVLAAAAEVGIVPGKESR